MIIIHNPYDPVSVSFVEDNSIKVLNWYDFEERQQWIAAGSPLQISAFPSVVMDLHPLVGGGHFISRKPVSIDDAVIEKKIHETKMLITLGDYENAQTWIDELSVLGVDTTELQTWLDSMNPE